MATPHLGQQIEGITRRLMSRVTGHETGEIDIIDAIKEDHKSLKELIKIMKGEKETFAQKKAAFEKFGATLVEHHIKEEENDMLPAFKNNSTSDERYKLGAKYLKLRAAYFTH